MKFEEALILMRNGKYVTRKIYNDCCRWYLKTDEVGIIHLMKDLKWNYPNKDGGYDTEWLHRDMRFIEVYDALAEDWEVFNNGL